jgi:hypothetical protein
MKKAKKISAMDVADAIGMKEEYLNAVGDQLIKEVKSVENNLSDDLTHNEQS